MTTPNQFLFILKAKKVITIVGWNVEAISRNSWQTQQIEKNATNKLAKFVVQKNLFLQLMGASHELNLRLVQQ